MKRINITLLAALPFIAFIFFTETQSVKITCLLTAIIYVLALINCRIIFHNFVKTTV